MKRYLAQINYYTSASSRATSDAAIPVKPNSSIWFTGRTDVLARLKEHFTAEAKIHCAVENSFCCMAWGGSGRLRFVWDSLRICLTSKYSPILLGPHFWLVPSFSHVFWIDASSIGTITQGLKGICNLPEARSSALDGSPQSALWWIGSLRENYAMVFDNADNLTPEELEQYFPSGLGGNILITSCNSSLKHLTLHESSLEVKEMEENDAIS